MYLRCIKRILDIFLCSIAMIVLSPVYLITAVGIKLSSKGPILYHSDRAGKNKEPFHFYKFRSMHVTEDKHMFVADQERVFPFGRFIRRLKIDELPQLINVIQGKMSVVGPRPMTIAGVQELYSGRYEIVSSIKPGLTSAASLYDYIVGDTYTDDQAYQREVLPVKLEMELLYVERQSFSYDVKLVLETMYCIAAKMFGKEQFKSMSEYNAIRDSMAEQKV